MSLPVVLGIHRDEQKVLPVVRGGGGGREAAWRAALGKLKRGFQHGEVSPVRGGLRIRGPRAPACSTAT